MIFYDKITELSEIFSPVWLLVSALLSVLAATSVILISRKYLQIIQQNGYIVKDYFKWLRRRGNIYVKRVTMVSLLSLLGYLLVTILFSFVKTSVMSYLGFVFYAVFLFLYVKSDNEHSDKCPIVYTKRLRRLMTSVLAVSFVCTFLLIIVANLIGFAFKEYELVARARLCIVCLIPCLTPIICALSALILSPFEKRNNNNYVKECTKTLAGFDNLIKIGITGSYGKTGVKEILKTMLSEKYKVLATPKSFNTPMGICKSVKELDSSYDVFIAEMGARRVGEIKELCDIVKPQYGIITGITEQHLETFGSLEAIKKTKAELSDSVQNFTVFACDNASTNEVMQAYPLEKRISAGLNDNLDVFATDISLTNDGSEFVLNLFGQKIKVGTKLVGKHNVQNICVAAALAFKLGLSCEQIASASAKLLPVAHRLEIVSNQFGTVIDDSYNSNIFGIDAALEVLSGFANRKIVVTPGLVEMGSIEKQQNKLFGKKLASACNLVILVGSFGAYDIRMGLLENGFPFESIIMAKTLEDAKKHLADIHLDGDVVLFENDLPDKFE